VQSEGLACPHERKRHTEGNIGSFKKPRPTSLPIRIRIKRKGEEDWSSQPTMEELIKHVAASMEENVLRHQLPLKEVFNLEWSWKEEPNKGGFKCTILAHVPTRSTLLASRTKKTTLEGIGSNLSHEQQSGICTFDTQFHLKEGN